MVPVVTVSIAINVKGSIPILRRLSTLREMLWAYWVTAKDWIRQTATVPMRW
jgi:hypothetical protein